MSRLLMVTEGRVEQLCVEIRAIETVSIYNIRK
jgi:hypothetical protein